MSEQQAFVCTCSDEGKLKAENLRSGRSIEQLIIDLNLISNSWVTIGVDQWWGVRVEGEINNWNAIDNLDIESPDEEYEKYSKEYKTFVQADELIDGLEKSLELWSIAHKDFTLYDYFGDK